MSNYLVPYETLTDAQLDTLRDMFAYAWAQKLIGDEDMAAADEMIADARRGDALAQSFCRESALALCRFGKAHEAWALAMPGCYGVARDAATVGYAPEEVRR